MRLFSGKCYSTRRLDGITAIVTGSNTGIGKETVMDFYKRGARVLMACRDLNKANDAKEDIVKSLENTSGVGELVVTKLDLMSLTSVRDCAKHILKTESRVDILVNNAGVMMCPKGVTEDGFEVQIGTNHFSHVLLTLLLFPRIVNSKPARIVNVSSDGYKGGSIDFDDINFEKREYSPMNAYCQSKLANILFTKQLAKIIEENKIEGLTTYSLHPGVISTELGRHIHDQYSSSIFTVLFSIIKYLFFKTPEQGAQTNIYCAIDEACANENGLYYKDCEPVDVNDAAKDMEVAEKLWNLSLKSVGLENWDPLANDKIID